MARGKETLVALSSCPRAPDEMRGWAARPGSKVWGEESPQPVVGVVGRGPLTSKAAAECRQCLVLAGPQVA